MIKLLDCTLRDGGYINDWNFGFDETKDIINHLEKSKTDIIEIGFLKDETYNINRTVFNDIKLVSNFLTNRNKDLQYALMVEVFNPIKLEKLDKKTDSVIDIIRVIVWKTRHDENNKEIDALKEGYDYCKGIVEKGYKLCVQPARVDQYSDEEFIAMIKMFNDLNPYAMYIVDSWGTRQIDDIIHYAYLADKYLDKNVAIGYHGHNNMLQVYGIATTFIHHSFSNRDLIVDGSVYGIGRCAGNLNIETFAKYLNDTENKNYNLASYFYIYERYIKQIYNEHKWGYSIYYFLTAIYESHPNYAWYLGEMKGIDPITFETILKSIPKIDRVLYNKEKAEKYARCILKGK